MIWTPEEVKEVRGLNLWQVFDELFLTRTVVVDKEDFVKEFIFREFRKVVHAQFLDVDPYDVSIVSMPTEVTGPPGIRARVDWNPRERPVELVGGPMHGRHCGAVDPKNSPAVSTYANPRGSLYADPNTAIFLRTSTYHFWGWNPTTRAWVYLYEGTN